MHFKLLLMTGSALALSATCAIAQTPPANASEPARDGVPSVDAATKPEAAEEDAYEVDEVVVVARETDVRTSIEGTSFSLSQDLQAVTGTLADALRNIPSVEVDPDGNVSLRGDANVTILVDGRPSSQFNGPGRGQLILQLPAGQYSRVELMANPSAAYNPEGSGGIINLITKPAAAGPGARVSGSLRANIGDGSRYNMGGNVVYTNGRLTLSADGGYRAETFDQEVLRVRGRLDAGSGRVLEARQIQSINGTSDNAILRAGAEYNLDDKTQVAAEIRRTDIDIDADVVDLYESDGPVGGIGSAYRRSATGGFEGAFSGATARFLRKFGGEGHEWTSEIRFDRSKTEFGWKTFVDLQLPAAPDGFERVENLNEQDQLGLTSAYTRPLSDGARLRLGYELSKIDLDQQNFVARGATPSSLVRDPLVSNTLHIDQTVHAGYATFERSFGEDVEAQFGLRLEQADISLDQAESGFRSSQSYFRAYPTFQLSYQLDDAQSFRASYSRRIQRPGPNQLNPFLSYQDNLNYSGGNPDLRPQETDSFELSWQRRDQQTFYQATLYHRDTSGAFTPVSRDLGNGIFVRRPENLGSSVSSGLELASNGALLSTLRYSASLNLFRQEIDAGGIFGAADRKGNAVSGRLTLNWQPTSADSLQVSGIWTGDQLQAQGVREQSEVFNFGYRRKLNDPWSLQITVRDVFDEGSSIIDIDTPTFRDRTEQTTAGRAIFIGLTWNFGGGQRRPEQFDFSAPATGN